ncbi:MAG TPA: hypothetical protein VMU74_10085 [Gaiellaceae bacterium]|nr:hypothetical protein [Gaiellaceae bacterium]
MASVDELERIASAAARPGEQVTGILAAELLDGARVYLCAYESGGWLALDDEGMPITSRQLVHDAVSLVALCEVAEETAGGGHLDELRARLAELRATEAPEGIEAAEEAATALADTLRPPPRLATTEYLDALGVASRRLEQTLGDETGSPFANALQQALPAVEELAEQVIARHLTPLT